MELTGAEIVCESLLKEGVDVVFGLPGGAVLPLYGAMAGYPGLRHMLVRHEQGAAMAADGYGPRHRQGGRVPGHLWVPGATNLVTGIANCPDGLGAHGGHHRAGAPACHRERRFFKRPTSPA